jgi:ABC-type uncharacterized transport system substrate-binding protein
MPLQAMPRLAPKHIARCLAAALPLLATTAPALAHPHIWVTVETTLLFDKGNVTGIRHRWLFDEMYTTMAIQGLDANNDGIYDRKELAELAKVNIDGLKEMGYFTQAKQGDKVPEFADPKDYFLEHTEAVEPPGPASQIEGPSATPPAAAPASPPASAPATTVWSRLKSKFGSSASVPAVPKAPKTMVLALEFTMPLRAPVAADAGGFSYSVSDPDMMIWFELDAAKGARSSGAPKGCTVAQAAPGKEAATSKALSDAFSGQLGASSGLGAVKSVVLSCTKS